MTSGWPGTEGAAGCTCSSPNRRPNALLLGVVHVLVAKEDDLMRHQRVVHLLERLVAERLRQIDASNLGADHRRYSMDLDRLRHADALPFVAANLATCRE